MTIYEDFVAEAADVDPNDFTWLVFKRKTSLRTQPQAYNQRHTLVLEYGDVYGVLKTRKQVYQLIKQNEMHILYRGIPQSVHDRIFDVSVPYKGQTPSLKIEPGFQRAKRKAVVPVEKKTMRRTEDFFKPAHDVVEKSELDYANYQWRKMTKRVRLYSKRHEKTQTVLQIGQLVGLRYVSPAKGSYIIYDDDHRVLVSHEMYVKVKDESKVLPMSQQREGVVDLETGKEVKQKVEQRPGSIIKRRDTKRAEPREVPPPVEETIVPKYDLSQLNDDDILKTTRRRENSGKRVRNVVNNILDLPEIPEWVGDDIEELFTDEDDGSVKQVKENDDIKEIEAEIKEQDEEHFDTPEDEEESTDDESAEDEDSELADELEPGSIIRVGKRTFVMLQSSIMERNANLMEYLFYDPENDDDEFMVYRLRLASNYMTSEFSKRAEILDDKFDDKELKSLLDKIEYAEFKPLPLVK